MHILTIENYHTTVALHADDCLTLARALHLAAHSATLPTLALPDATRARVPEWTALALFLETAALASEAAPAGAWVGLHQDRPRTKGASLPPAPWPRRTQPGRPTDLESATCPDPILQRLHERAADTFGEEAAHDLFAGVLVEGIEMEEGAEGEKEPAYQSALPCREAAHPAPAAA